MARLPYIEYEDAAAPIREALDVYPPEIRTRRIWGIMSHAEDALPPMITYVRTLATRSVIDPALRELAVIRVAQLTPGADYTWAEHVPIAMALGIQQGQVDALVAGELGPESLGDDASLVIAFTDQFVRDAQPDDATWEAMTARFSPREIVELMLVIGHFMMIGRIHATARTDLDTEQDRLPVDAQFYGDRPGSR